jgi:hypothetical protein
VFILALLKATAVNPQSQDVRNPEGGTSFELWPAFWWAAFAAWSLENAQTADTFD